MTQQSYPLVDTGRGPNDQNADVVRVGFDKLNTVIVALLDAFGLGGLQSYGTVAITPLSDAVKQLLLAKSSTEIAAALGAVQSASVYLKADVDSKLASLVGASPQGFQTLGDLYALIEGNIYAPATEAVSGLMSATDKTRFDNLFNPNTGQISPESIPLVPNPNNAIFNEPTPVLLSGDVGNALRELAATRLDTKFIATTAEIDAESAIKGLTPANILSVSSSGPFMTALRTLLNAQPTVGQIGDYAMLYTQNGTAPTPGSTVPSANLNYDSPSSGTTATPPGNGWLCASYDVTSKLGLFRRVS